MQNIDLALEHLFKARKAIEDQICILTAIRDESTPVTQEDYMKATLLKEIPHFPTRLWQALENIDIITLKDLSTLSIQDMYKVRGVGKTNIDILKRLDALGMIKLSKENKFKTNHLKTN